MLLLLKKIFLKSYIIYGYKFYKKYKNFAIQNENKQNCTIFVANN